MQPMMEVVRAELYCVLSMMEYIKTKLQNRESEVGRRFHLLVQGSSKFSSQAVLPHDTGEHKLHQEHQIGPALKRWRLQTNNAQGQGCEHAAL